MSIGTKVSISLREFCEGVAEYCLVDKKQLIADCMANAPDMFSREDPGKAWTLRPTNASGRAFQVTRMFDPGTREIHLFTDHSPMPKERMALRNWLITNGGSNFCNSRGGPGQARATAPEPSPSPINSQKLYFAATPEEGWAAARRASHSGEPISIAMDHVGDAARLLERGAEMVFETALESPSLAIAAALAAGIAIIYFCPPALVLVLV